MNRRGELSRQDAAGRFGRGGFSLLELLIVTSAIGVGAALLLCSAQKVRELALATECGNNLRQIGLACHHVNDLHGKMPSAWNWFPSMTVQGGAGIGPVFFHLLPYIEQDALYRSSHFQSASPPQDYFDYAVKANARQVAIYSCPLDPTLPAAGGAPEMTPWAASSYAANFLVFGRVDENLAYVDPLAIPQLQASFPDGTSNTLLFGEKYAVLPGAAGQPKGGCHWAYWGQSVYGPFFALHDQWTDVNSVGPVRQLPGDKRDSRFQHRPAPGNVNPSRCATGHPGGMSVCFADATVRTLSPDIDRFVWWGLVTPSGGE